MSPEDGLFVGPGAYRRSVAHQEIRGTGRFFGRSPLQEAQTQMREHGDGVPMSAPLDGSRGRLATLKALLARRRGR